MEPTSPHEKEARVFGRPMAGSPGAEPSAAAPNLTDPSSKAPLGEADRSALALWRDLRAANARKADLERQHGAARSTIPWQFRAGPRWVGRNLDDQAATEISPWPAIVGVEQQEYGRRDIRPGPSDIFSRYQTEIGVQTPPFDDEEEEAAYLRRCFDRFADGVAKLAERVKAQRAAEAASGGDRLHEEWNRAGEAANALEDKIVELPCDNPHAAAAAALIRWEHERGGETVYVAPNSSFWRNFLTGILPHLSGEIAEDAADALAQPDDGAAGS